MIYAVLAAWAMAWSVQPEPATTPAVQPENAAQPEPAPAAERIADRIPAANAEVRMPKGRWKASPREENAAFAQFTRAGGYILTIAYEESGEGGPDDATGARDLAGYAFAAKTKGFVFVDERPQEVDGIAGLRFRADYELGNKTTRLEVWTGMLGGNIYRVSIEGPKARAEWLTTELDSVLSGYTVIDRKRVAKLKYNIVASPLKTDAGVTLRWPARSKMDLRPGYYGGPFEGSATLLEGLWSSCTVTPLHIAPLHASDEDILAGVAQRFGFVKRTPWVKVDEASGARRWLTSVTMGVDAWKIRKRAAVIIKDDAALLIQAWTLRKDGDEEYLKALTEETTFDGMPPAPEIAALARGARQNMEIVLWQIGENLVARGDHAGGATFMLRAMEYERQPALVTAAAKALVEAGRTREAAELFEKGPAPTEAKALLAWHLEEARLRAKIGDNPGACAAYERYFATGNRDDAVLGEYLGLLEAAERHGELVDAIEKLVGGDRTPFRKQQASALAHLGRVDEAVALLKGPADARPANWDAIFAYVDLLAELDRAADVEAECRGRLKEFPEATGLLVRLGRAEMSLGWFARARDTFERALKLSPGHKVISEDLASATRALGQGDRSLIATGIEAVPLPEDVRTLPELPEGSEEAPTVTELDARAIRFVPGKEYRWTQTTRLKAVTRAGVDASSTIDVDFKPAFEKVCVNAVRIIDAAGTVTDVDPASFYVKDAEEASETKTLVLPATGLAVGGVVEAVYTVQAINPPETMPYDFFWFVSRAPMRRNVLWVDAPRETLAWTATKGVAVATRESGVMFTMDRVPASWREAASAPIIDWADHVVIGPKGRSWETLGREYLGQIAAVVDLETPAEVKEAARKADKPGGSLRERTLAISSYVQRELAYKFIAFGPRAYIPRPCGVPLGEKSGDCKDHAVLLRAMLKSVGIEAHLALTSFRKAPSDEIADMDAFEHMVVYVPELEGGTFLDATANSLAADLAGHWSQTRALVLNPAKPRLVDVAYRQTEKVGFEVVREVLVKGDGLAVVKEDVLCFGRDASYFRDQFEGTTAEERKRWLEAFVEYAELPAKVTSHEITGLEDPNADVKLHIEYEVAGAFRNEGGVLVGQAPTGLENSRLRAARVEKRRTPFRFGRWVFDATTIVRGEKAGSPAGGGYERTTPAGNARVTNRVEDGALTIRMRMEDVPGTHEPERWEAYAEMSEGLLAELRRPLRLTPTPTPTP